MSYDSITKFTSYFSLLTPCKNFSSTKARNFFLARSFFHKQRTTVVITYVASTIDTYPTMAVRPKVDLASNNNVYEASVFNKTPESNTSVFTSLIISWQYLLLRGRDDHHAFHRFIQYHKPLTAFLRVAVNGYKAIVDIRHVYVFLISGEI